MLARTSLMVALIVVWCGDRPVQAQSPQLPSWADSIVTVIPGPQYRRGGVSAAFAGRHYRDLWTTPIRVPVVNLQRFVGGLTPMEAHAGHQTRSLRFAGAVGRSYQFRSVDKDPTALRVPELQGTIVARGMRDGVSASFPAAPLMANALLEAVGVLTQPQTLVVLPDGAALGKFPAEFRGVLGLLEERLDEQADDAGGLSRVLSPTRLFQRLDAGPDDRVDARAFWAARLMDIFIGDRDRHRDQLPATARSRWTARYRDDPASSAARIPGGALVFNPAQQQLSAMSETRHPIWPRGCLPLPHRDPGVSGECPATSHHERRMRRPGGQHSNH